MNRRRAWGLLFSLALGGCAHTSEQVLEREVLREHKPPLPGNVRVATVDGPKRPRTVAAVDFDVRALPTLESVALQDLEPGEGTLEWRNGSELVVPGLEGVDVEIDRDRWLAEKRSVPTGTRKFGATTSLFVTWRGPATVDDAGRLGFMCFEGAMQGTDAKAAKAYRVAAEPVVPGVVWAFRSGRPDSPYARRDLGQGVQSPLAPEPCVGVERVEFIGPSAFWIVGSSVDPRDRIAAKCNVDGGCPFSRIIVPLEEGALTSALFMSDDPGQLERLSTGPRPANLTQFGGAPPHADVFEYTFELDWTRPAEGAFGHVLIGASAVPVSKLGPAGSRGR